MNTKTKITEKIDVNIAQNLGDVTSPQEKQPSREKLIIQIDPCYLPNVALPEVQDIISDAEAQQLAQDGPTFVVGYTESIPPRHETLPTVINKTIYDPNKKHSPGSFDPKWIKIRHLPGYTKAIIRSIARGIFSHYTDHHLENINFMSTLTHAEIHVKTVATYIVKNGIQDDDGTLDLSRLNPIFNAEVKLWRTNNHSYLIVKDAGGHYIYQWDGGRGVHLNKSSKILLK